MLEYQKLLVGNFKDAELVHKNISFFRLIIANDPNFCPIELIVFAVHLYLTLTYQD